MARRDALSRIQKTLVGRRNELRQRIRTEIDDLGSQREAISRSDAVDQAFGSTGEELSSQLAEVEARELNQVERAIKRLKQGTYGLCETCSCKIPVARLNVLPYSTMCIKCQRSAESDGEWLLNRRNGSWESLVDHNDSTDLRPSDLERDFIR